MLDRFRRGETAVRQQPMIADGDSKPGNGVQNQKDRDAGPAKCKRSEERTDENHRDPDQTETIRQRRSCGRRNGNADSILRASIRSHHGFTATPSCAKMKAFTSTASSIRSESAVPMPCPE